MNNKLLPFSQLESGITASVSSAVKPNQTAALVGSGDLEVFSTPYMIAMMEQASCEVLSAYMEDGMSSVGTKINVSHTSASTVGATITATATVTAVNGRTVEFQVSACDDVGEIGSGTHVRVIVNRERFLEKLKSKYSHND